MEAIGSVQYIAERKHWKQYIEVIESVQLSNTLRKGNIRTLDIIKCHTILFIIFHFLQILLYMNNMFIFILELLIWKNNQ